MGTDRLTIENGEDFNLLEFNIEEDSEFEIIERDDDIRVEDLTGKYELYQQKYARKIQEE
jgi:hypothetical protein